MNIKPTILLMCLTLLGASHPAQANFDVRFVESAPKDWFSITNMGDCSVPEMSLQIDLSMSAGKLIFDTTATGAGVEVFQPFEIREGNIRLSSDDAIKDGEDTLTVVITDLGPGSSASFTIDVDDTLPNSALGKIRVSGAEITGGTATITVEKNPAVQGSFNQKGLIMLPSPACS